MEVYRGHLLGHQPPEDALKGTETTPSLAFAGLVLGNGWLKESKCILKVSSSSQLVSSLPNTALKAAEL